MAMAKVKSAGARPSRRKRLPLSMNTSRSDVPKNLRVFIKGLRETANESAGLPSADNNARRNLRKDAKLLARSVKSLVKIIEMHEALMVGITEVFQDVRPVYKAKLIGLGPFDPGGLVHLSSVLAAAFYIGALAHESPIFRQLERNTKAASARKGLTAKSQQDDRAILKIFESLRADHPDWKAPRFAAAIANAKIVTLKDNSIEKKVRKMIRSRTDKKTIPA